MRDVYSAIGGDPSPATGSSVPSEREWALCRVTWRRSYLSGSFVAVADDDPTDEIAASPRFRWRGGEGAPPQLPDIVACLDALSAELTAAGWEPTWRDPAGWCALRFRRRIVSLQHRLKAYDAPPDADMVSWLTEQATAASARDDTIFGEETWRLAAIKNAVSRNEAKRLEEARVEAERLEAERLEAERLEAERLETERLETERLVAERLAAAQAEAERLAAEQRAARLAAEQLEAERAEAERRAIERLEADRRRELERIAAEHAEAERAETRRVAAVRLEAEHRRAAPLPPVQLPPVQPELLQPEPVQVEPAAPEPPRKRSDPWALTSRLNAYTAKDEAAGDIRSAFDRKRDGKVRRDHRR